MQKKPSWDWRLSSQTMFVYQNVKIVFCTHSNASTQKSTIWKSSRRECCYCKWHVTNICNILCTPSKISTNFNLSYRKLQLQLSISFITGSIHSVTRFWTQRSYIVISCLFLSRAIFPSLSVSPVSAPSCDAVSLGEFSFPLPHIPIEAPRT